MHHPSTNATNGTGRQSRRTRQTVVAAGVLLAATAGPSLAQDFLGAAHPVGVYAGTCDGFDQQPLLQLGEATLRDDDDDASGEAPFVGGGGVIPVAVSVTEVAAGLDDFVGQPHVVVVFGADDDPAAVLACGQIGGALFDDEVMFGLRGQGGSGDGGIAIVEEDDDGDLEFRVYVASPGAAGSIGTGSDQATGGTDDGDDDDDDGSVTDAAGNTGVPATGGDDDGGDDDGDD